MASILSLLVFIFAAALAAAPGIFFRPGIWYEQLIKPSWVPPDWLFGPVWSVLYLTIAVAGWLVWRRHGTAEVGLPLTIFGLQLLLNALWTVIFFGLHRPDIAMLEIVVLWLAIIATIILFYDVKPIAAYLLVPYAAWVGFAAILNFSIWRLNAAAISS